jgi:hypothetical protein
MIYEWRWQVLSQTGGFQASHWKRVEKQRDVNAVDLHCSHAAPIT